MGRWRRELDWWLQNRLTLSLPARRRAVGAAPLGELGETGGQRYRELAARYDLSRWPALCEAAEWRHSLWLLDLLDRLGPPPPGRGLDVGSGPWSYLPALVAWSGGGWDGVELDAHRRYLNLATRRAYGEAMAAALPGCRYRAASLLELAGRYGAVTWLLPLLTPARHAAHRLPHRLFQPEALLRHAWGLLEPGGWMVVVNEGEAEAAEQGRLFGVCGIVATPLGRVDGPLSPFRRERFGWLAVR